MGRGEDALLKLSPCFGVKGGRASLPWGVVGGISNGAILIRSWKELESALRSSAGVATIVDMVGHLRLGSDDWEELSG